LFAQVVRDILNFLAWEFSPDSPIVHGWQKSLPFEDGAFLDNPVLPFYMGDHLIKRGSVGVRASVSRYVYGSWESPIGEIPYFPNQVYRMIYKIRNPQGDPMHAPNCRLFTECLVDDVKLCAAGGGRLGRGMFAPDGDGETYRIYFYPPDLSFAQDVDLRVKFEVIDFSEEEWGDLFLDEFRVERFPLPEKSSDKLVASFSAPSDFAPWVPIVFGSPFGPAICGSDDTGLFITTPGPVEYPSWNLGIWSLPCEVSPVYFNSDRLYRAVYTLSVPTEAEHFTIGKIRMYSQNSVGNWGGILNLVPDHIRDHMPGVEGSEYDIFYESMPDLYTGDEGEKNRMYFSFDVQDGLEEQMGTVYLNKLELYEYAIP